MPTAPPAWEPWHTASIEVLKKDRKAKYEKATAVLDEFSSELAALDAKIADEQTSAAEGLGRLLTADGDDLKEAVADALAIVGFEVTDVDETLSEGEGKREDLWVALEGEEGVFLVEVKGYSKGARVRDLMRSQEYELLYLEKHDKRARGQWHVVNANRGQEPHRRKELFDGHEDVIQGYGGLIVDTRDLFRLVRDVQRGRMSNDEAARRLWEASPGTFRYPS